MNRLLFGKLLFLPLLVSAVKLQGEIRYIQDTTQVHELTIYAVPSYSKLDWGSPARLYRTSVASFLVSRFVKYSYSIGHMLIKFESPVVDSVVYAAMRSTSNSEKIQLFMKEKVGLAILGVPMKGRLETKEEITALLGHYSKKGTGAAFIRYRLSRESALRVKTFLENFSRESKSGFTPCNYYGGAFWPRYEKEGAGCSSFALSALEAAGVCIDKPEWRVEVNIPYALIGGRYNKQKKVGSYDIESRRRWHSGRGVPNKDFFPFSIYDPTLVYNWIHKMFIHPVDGYYSDMREGFAGLVFDARSIKIEEGNPVMMARKDSSIFIDLFKKNHLQN